MWWVRILKLCWFVSCVSLLVVVKCSVVILCLVMWVRLLRRVSLLGLSEWGCVLIRYSVLMGVLFGVVSGWLV